MKHSTFLDRSHVINIKLQLEVNKYYTIQTKDSPDIWIKSKTSEKFDVWNLATAANTVFTALKSKGSYLNIVRHNRNLTN